VRRSVAASASSTCWWCAPACGPTSSGSSGRARRALRGAQRRVTSSEATAGRRGQRWGAARAQACVALGRVPVAAADSRRLAAEVAPAARPPLLAKEIAAAAVVWASRYAAAARRRTGARAGGSCAAGRSPRIPPSARTRLIEQDRRASGACCGWRGACADRGAPARGQVERRAGAPSRCVARRRNGRAVLRQAQRSC